jgi:hypothetical protein
MHRSGWTPSIVPGEHDQAVYLVMDDRGERGQVWTEADSTSDLAAVIQDMLAGQYNNPVRVVVFTPPRDGRATSRPMLLRNCVSVATCSCATFPFFCSRLSTAMRADTRMSRFHCQSGWRERGGGPAAPEWS